VTRVLDDVPGQETAMAFLRGALARPHHAYVLAGPEGSGKSLAARAFAAALLCQQGGCGECRDCRLALGDRHPNEFVVEPTTKSGTDWVVTFPTKREYYTGTTVLKLFQSNFTATGACDDVVITQYDREERTIVSQTSFSPPPPTQTDSLCWEANVISFAGTNVLGSKNVSNIGTTFSNGWVALNFNGSTVPAGRHQLVGGTSQTVNLATTPPTIGTLATTTFNGLPVIGFAAITFENGTLTSGGLNVQSNYGGEFVHKLTRSIQ
jgi:hypothetical protein